MRLHELLAVEKNALSQCNILFQETLQKFGKGHYFTGWIKRLKMIKESPDNVALEESSSEDREVPTTVYDTLEYVLNAWSKSEDLQLRKNIANQKAIGNLELKLGNTDQILATGLPVDELMGLENRLLKIRDMFQAIPTLEASKSWVPSDLKENVWKVSNPDVTTKTEKITIPVVLYEATKDHPAQVEKISRDDVVGTYSIINFSGAVPTLKKAAALQRIEELIEEVKKARMRANCVEVPNASIGNKLAEYLLEPLK